MVVTFYLVTLILDQAELRANDKQSMTIKGPKLSQDARPLTSFRHLFPDLIRKLICYRFSCFFSRLFFRRNKSKKEKPGFQDERASFEKYDPFRLQSPGPALGQGREPAPLRADGLIDAGDDDDLRITPPSPRACSIQVIGDFSWGNGGLLG
ncbi:hypothetical protein CDAR_39761 [Caerostris darwini]|uniref:Uncharacterized protein n=1 Tax=Caerostris darwini TaxID=1538125 RepID=A0AAV4U6N4_9ARAC|nr:hypothetical protein CDAR_39761 [Caerostris darwini]